MHLVEIIGRVDGEWRRDRAEEYRDDERNLEAADTLDHIAEELPDYEGGHYHSRLASLRDYYAADGGVRFNEILSELWADVGFGCGVTNAAEFLEEAISRLEMDGPYLGRNSDVSDPLRPRTLH